jgi:hypothetical protein
VTSDTKTARSRRSVNLPLEMIAVLRAHRAQQTKARLALGPGWVDSGFIFTSSVGTPMDPRNVHREFRAICRAAGLGDWHPLPV